MAIQKLLFDPLQDEVKKVQSKSIKFEGCDEVQEPANTEGSVLSRIKDFDLEVCEAALGSKLAKRLRGFALAVDLSHPSISELFEGQLVEGDFSSDCCALLSLAEFARKNEPTIFNRIKKIGQDFESPSHRWRKSVEKSLDDPSNNQLYVRFVKERKERDKIRSTKRMQTINVGIIEKKGHDIWSSHGDTFSNYCRYDNVWAEEIEQARKELDRFKKLGCDDLSFGIEKDIENFENQIQDNYFGFNRIPMTHAAVILAKVHGYQIKNSSYRNRYSILIPRNYFNLPNFKHDFVVQDIRAQDADYSWFNYEPRSYTVKEMMDHKVVSSEMKEILDYLENLPEVGGRPIFDHYRVLVPGISYPKGDWSRGSYVNRQGRKITGNVAQIKIELDMMFIKDGLFCPILLGEKDEHCYFISYWV